MDTLAFGLLFVVTAAIVFQGLGTRQAGILQFPFLAAAVMAGWFLPQALKLHEEPTLPIGGYSLTMLYAAFAMFALWLGDKQRIRSTKPIEQFDERGLAWGALFLSLVGAAAYALILRTTAEKTEEGLTTGIVTIYFFLYRAQYFGYALALILCLRKPSPFTLALVIFNISSLSGFILFGGRRGPAVELFLVSACAFWFQRRWLVPKMFMLVGIALGALFTAAAGRYRTLMQSINDPTARTGEARLPTLDEVLSIDWVGEFTEVSPEATFEVTNAVNYVSAAWETLSFDFGLSYWNYLIFRYVPGQFVGHDVKTSLQVALPDLPAQTYGYARHIGTTFTGFADSFTAFGPLGVLVFFLIARMLRHWWDRAERGSIRDQYYYCAMIATALHGITHATLWFVVAVPQLIVFSYFVFHFSPKLAKRIPNVMRRVGAENRTSKGAAPQD